MLTILWGRSGSGKTAAILNELTARARAGERDLIWLTPEPFSHECERMLAQAGGASICLSAEVLTFRRLTERVLAAEGGAAQPVLDEGGRLLTMRLAVDRALPDLRYWKRSAPRAEFLEQLLATYDQCRCYRLTPETLQSAAEFAEGASVDKLKELALIYAIYDGLTAQTGLDPRARTEQLADRLRSGDWLREKRLFVDGYITFTPLEHGVLDICIDKAVAVTAALTGEPEDPFFAVTRRTAERLCRHAGAYEIQRLDKNCRAAAPELLALERYATEAPPACDTPIPDGGDGAALRLAHCESASAELDTIAEMIHAWTAQGLRYRDIAVVLPPTGPYAALAEAHLHKAGIPVFMDSMDDIRGKPLLRLLRAAVDVLEHGWRPEDILELLRTGLTRVPDSAADELENYTRLWRLEGRRWSGSAPWTLPPGGYGHESPDDPALLRRLNRARTLLNEPLKALQGSGGARTWAQRFTEFLVRCRVPRTLKRRARRLQELGEVKLAEENRQLWRILTDGLTQCAAVLGDMPMSRSEFCDFFLLLMSAYSVGSIPASLDRVTVGAAGRLRRLQVRAAAIPGARARYLPSAPESASLLSPEERSALESVQAALPPDNQQRDERARLDVYMALALPSERLLVTWCPEDKADLPAELVERIQTQFGLCPYEPVRPQPPTLEQPYQNTPLSEEWVERLYGRSIYLSASRLGSLFGCRRAFFMRYGLGALPRAEEGFSLPDHGTFVHHVLEKTGLWILHQNRKPADVDAQEVREAAGRFADEYIGEVLQGFQGQSKRFAHTFAALSAAAVETADNVFAELRGAQFVPAAYELTFGDRGDLPAIPVARVSRFNILLGGKVDRVDLWTGDDGTVYVRAVDYKSSVKSIDYGRLYAGLDMQLPVYLRALVREAAGYFRAPQLVPAGVNFIPARVAIPRGDAPMTRDEAAEAIREGMRRGGVLLSDRAVLDAMDTPVGGKCPYQPVSYTKDGAPHKRNAKVATREQLEAMILHVGRKMEQAGRYLAAGDVSAHPLAAGDKLVSCEHCDFTQSCLFDRERDTPEALPEMDRETFLFRVTEDAKRGETDG